MSKYDLMKLKIYFTALANVGTTRKQWSLDTQ